MIYSYENRLLTSLRVRKQELDKKKSTTDGSAAECCSKLAIKTKGKTRRYHRRCDQEPRTN